MKDSILILSGGMDSVTMLYDKQEEIAMEEERAIAAAIAAVHRRKVPNV